MGVTAELKASLALREGTAPGRGDSDQVLRFADGCGAVRAVFLVPDAPANAPTRESIELRTLVFHKE
jgi:hypothetical protein